MKSSKVCGAWADFQSGRRSALLAAVGIAAVAPSTQAALTVYDFTTGHGLDASANYTPASVPPVNGSLIDITGNTSTFVAATSSAKTASATFGTGAIAIDESSIGGSATTTQLVFQGNDVSSTAAGVTITLNLTGGNTGTTAGTGTNGTTPVATPATAAGDLFTLTNNFPAGDSVFFDGGDANLVVNVGSTGGNFDIANGGTVTFGSNSNTVSGVTTTYTSSLAGAGNINVTGGGTLRLLNTSTNTGGYTLSGGSTLSITNSGPTLGTAPASAPEVLFNGGTFTVTGSFTATPFGSTRTLAFAGGVTGNNINIGSGLTDDLAAPFIDQIGTTGGSFNKIGAGTLIISNTGNTISGGITVAAGSLMVDSSLATSSGISVASGATLGGVGVVPAITTVSGSIVSPGDPATYSASGTTSMAHTGAAAGTLTASSLSMAAGSVYNFDLESSTNDLLTLTGSGATGGGGVFDLYQAGTSNPVDPGLYDLFAFTGSAVDGVNLSTLTLGNMPTATYTFETDPANGDLAVMITAVPEPVSGSLLGLAAIAGLARRRRSV